MASQPGTARSRSHMRVVLPTSELKPLTATIAGRFIGYARLKQFVVRGIWFSGMKVETLDSRDRVFSDRSSCKDGGNIRSLRLTWQCYFSNLDREPQR